MKKVKIQLEIYEKIMLLCNEKSYETGGYLGRKGDIICEFEFDSGIKSKNKGVYNPDEKKLHMVLQKWEVDNILLCGILHTHLAGKGLLSQGDIEFISGFMKYNMTIYKEFYFPIVLPENKLIFYQATKLKDKNIEIKEIKYCF